jgi:tripartite-type tricarboxylate transporter receptor subunit TctC
MVANADVREKLLAQGAQPIGNKPDEFRAFIAAELAKWSKDIKAIGIKEE